MGNELDHNQVTSKSTINLRQVIIGIAALIVGALVYLVDRPPDQTYFLYFSGLDISFYNSLPKFFGSIGNSLPAFIHVFAFILITAGLISCKKKGYRIICLSWLIVDLAFELGQKYNSLPAKVIPNWFDGIFFLENTRNYFLHGTFDPVDLVAIILGTATAYLILSNTMERRLRSC